MLEPVLCQLCERPPFADTTLPRASVCNLCFQLIKISGYFRFTNLNTGDTIVLTTIDNTHNDPHESPHDTTCVKKDTPLRHTTHEIRSSLHLPFPTSNKKATIESKPTPTSSATLDPHPEESPLSLTQTKTKIEWLFHNSNHNPQGFRDATSHNHTARKLTSQVVAQCISQALDLTTSNNNTLSLVNFDISKLPIDCYLNMVSLGSNVTTMKLVKVGMVDSQFNLLLCFVAQNSSVKNILVSSNQLTEESLRMVLNFVRKIKQLERVYMNNNRIGGFGGRKLLNQIKECGVQTIYI